MAKMTISNEWWTAPAVAENGQTIMVTGRSGMQNVRNTGKYRFRITISYPYDADSVGMPTTKQGQILNDVTEALTACFSADPVAINTGIYTGAGRRDWVFYTMSLHIFQKKLNQALAELPLLPLEFEADEDPQWAEYDEMCQCEVGSND